MPNALHAVVIALTSACLLACGKPPAPPAAPALRTAASPLQRLEAEPWREPASDAARGAAAGTASGQSLRRAPACSYLSVAEVSNILQGPIGTPSEKETDGTSSCGYPPLDMTSYQQAQIDIRWNAGGGETFEDTLANAFGGSAVGRQVAHRATLGDGSSYSREGVLRIHAGATLISITLLMRPDSEQKAVALGRLLLQRLGYTGASAAADGQ